MLTTEELAELKRLEALAEPGPWSFELFAGISDDDNINMDMRLITWKLVVALRNKARKLIEMALFVLAQEESREYLHQENRRAWDTIYKLQKENERLRLRVLSAAGDDLCRLSQEEIKVLSSGAVQIPPKEEFIASCERFHQQIASTDGVLTNCLTLAQMIAENERLRGDNANLKAAILAYGNNPAGFDWAVLARTDELEAEVASLKRDNDKLHNECQDYANKLGEWQDATGCSHPGAAKEAMKANE